MTNELDMRQRAVLLLLAGCPNGATAHNLVTQHDVAPSVIYRLVELGLVQPEQRTIRPPHNFPICWILITDAGRAAIAAQRKRA